MDTAADNRSGEADGRPGIPRRAAEEVQMGEECGAAGTGLLTFCLHGWKCVRQRGREGLSGLLTMKTIYLDFSSVYHPGSALASSSLISLPIKAIEHIVGANH